MKKKLQSSLPIEELIMQRLKLQTNQRILSDRYNINIFNAKYFFTQAFLSIYQTWDEIKKREFARILGGPIHEKKITKLLNLEKP